MKSSFNILVVDDEQDMRESLRDLLVREGYQIDLAANGMDAVDKILTKSYDVVLTDIVMPEMDGVELLKEIRKRGLECSVIMISGYSTVEGAVDAIKLGAEDYFTKPFNNSEVLNVIEKVYKSRNYAERNKMLKQEVLRKSLPEIIGESKAIRKVFSEIEAVADSDVSVLITGESGTGKELVAGAIHSLSKRREEPFVPINCAAVPNELLESEFFGHEKGSFSGAHERKYGLFEVADKGTLFLDEIGEMPMNLQSKLLRTVETNSLRRIGGTQQIDFDTRIISSTNRDLKEEIKKRCFRGDLYFRLNTFAIHLPPLRERKEDIPLLVDNYLKTKGHSDLKVSDEIVEALTAYHWPGNVRELENVVERMVLTSSSSIPKMKNLPIDIQGAYKKQTKQTEMPLDAIPVLENVEREHILNVYKVCNGDKVAAAKALGIGLKTLYRKLDAYGVKDLSDLSS